MIGQGNFRTSYSNLMQKIYGQSIYENLFREDTDPDKVELCVKPAKHKR